MTIDTKKKYLMTMETSCGTIKIELDPSEAPNTVNSVVFLAGQHFFDGTLFHRTVQGFVIQGGDPLTAGGNDPSVFGTGGGGDKRREPAPAGAADPPGEGGKAQGGGGGTGP